MYKTKIGFTNDKKRETGDSPIINLFSFDNQNCIITSLVKYVKNQKNQLREP